MNSLPAFSRRITWLLPVLFVVIPMQSCRHRKSIGAIASTGVPDEANETRMRYAARVKENLDAMILRYPAPEIQRIISSVRDQVVGIMASPMQLQNSRTTVFTINSFPGGGKTTFINELARSLEIAGERKVIKTVRPDMDYLPMDELKTWSVSTDALSRGSFSTEQIMPAILAFDEYTHTVTDAGKIWLGKPENRKIYEDNGIKLPSEFGPIIARLRAEKERYELMSDEQRRSQMSSDAANRANGNAVGADNAIPKSLSGSAQDSLDLLWTATGDGRIDKGGTVNADDIIRNIRSSKEQVAKVRMDLEEEQTLKQILDEEWSEEQAKQQSNIPPPPLTAADTTDATDASSAAVAAPASQKSPNVATPAAEKSPKSLELEKEMKVVTDKIADLEENLTSIYNAAENQLNNLRTKEEILGGIIAASEMGEWSTRVIERWKSDPSIPASRQKARHRMDTVRIKENIQEMDRIERIKIVFKADPARFITELEKVISNQSQTGKAYTGHIFIFLLGNILPLQDRVTETINRPGVCDAFVNNNPNPDLRAKAPQDDPDCLRTTSDKIMKEPVKHPSGTFGNLSQELALRQVFGSVGGNDLAFNSRFTNRVFMTPPSREQYAQIISSEMDYWKLFVSDAVEREFPGHPIKVVYDKSVLSLLYRTRVEGQAGFRSIGGAARQLLSSFMVLSVTNALLGRVENKQVVDAGYANAANYAPETLNVPNEIRIRYDDPSTSLVASDDAGAEFDRVKVYLDEPIKTQKILEEEARTTQRRYFLAGELGIGALVFGSPPPNDLLFYMPKRTNTLELTPIDKAWKEPGVDLVEYKRALILSLVAGQVSEIEFFLNQAFSSEEGIFRLHQARGRIEKFYEELKGEAERRHKDPLDIEKVIPANLHNAPITREFIKFARAERSNPRERLSSDQVEEILDVSRDVVAGLIGQYRPYIKMLADRLENHEGELRQTVIDVFAHRDVKMPKNLVVEMKRVASGQFNRDTAPFINELIAMAPKKSFWLWAKQRAGDDWDRVTGTLGFKRTVD